MRSQTKSGFTLIELLVVVAIIGLLLSVMSLTFTRARQKTRDTKRITDMKQLKTGLDLYYENGSGYPDTGTFNGAVGGSLVCSSVNIVQVPRDPLYPTYSYSYTASGDTYSGCGGTVRSAYTLRFYIENKGGYYTIDQNGTVRDSGNNPVSFDTLL